MQLKEYLMSIGVPEQLSAITLADLDETYKEKVLSWTKIVNNSLPITIISGNKSIHKDKVLIYLIREFAKLGKSIFYGSMFNFIELNYPVNFVYAIYDMERITNLNDISKVKVILTDHVRNKRPLLIETINIKQIEKIYGSDFIDYISDKMIEINIETQRSCHIVLI
jgi:hypothetical protein